MNIFNLWTTIILFSSLNIFSILYILGTTTTFIASISTTISKSTSIEEISNPNISPNDCGRSAAIRSSICDPDLILTRVSKDVIEGFTNAISSNAQVAVVLINKMNLEELDTNDIDQAAEIFATSLHNNWGVGSKELNNGVLIFLSVQDRVVFISVGKGIERKLNKSSIDQIIKKMQFYFSKGDFASGLQNGLILMDLILSGLGGGQIQQTYRKNKLSNNDFLICGTIIGAIGLISFFQFRRLQRLQRGRIVLDKLLFDIDSNDHKFLGSSCPMCLRSFPMVTPEQNNSLVITDPIVRPVSLSCGHLLCESCMLKKCKVCPVCDYFSRKDEDRDDYNHFFDSNRSKRKRTTLSWSWDYYPPREDVVRFRLNRIRQLYPEVYPDPSDLQTMPLGELRSRLFSKKVEVSRTIEDMVKTSSTRSRDNGSSGSSWTFGGGTSSPGGGGGGRY